MVNRKTRRHSGRVYPQSTINAKKGKIINECLEPQAQWSDWIDYRDGQRSPVDKTKLRKISKRMKDENDYFERRMYNKKIKKEIKRKGLKNGLYKRPYRR